MTNATASRLGVVNGARHPTATENALFLKVFRWRGFDCI